MIYHRGNSILENACNKRCHRPLLRFLWLTVPRITSHQVEELWPTQSRDLILLRSERLSWICLSGTLFELLSKTTLQKVRNTPAWRLGEFHKGLVSYLTGWLTIYNWLRYWLIESVTDSVNTRQTYGVTDRLTNWPAMREAEQRTFDFSPC